MLYYMCSEWWKMLRIGFKPKAIVIGNIAGQKKQHFCFFAFLFSFKNGFTK